MNRKEITRFLSEKVRYSNDGTRITRICERIN